MAEQFSEIERNAMAGDIRAQRQLADCYLNGCPGLASPDPALACAWHIVIGASGHPDLAQADFDRRRRGCERLSSTEQSAAQRQARTIFLIVYGRELVLPADFFGGPPPPRT
jgi:hypothetical protein